MTPSGADRLRRSDAHQSKDLGNEFLCYDGNAERVHVLNEVAREVFIRCDGSRTAVEIARELEPMYDVPPDVLRKDVLAVAGRMLDLGLLTVEPGS